MSDELYGMKVRVEPRVPAGHVYIVPAGVAVLLEDDDEPDLDTPCTATAVITSVTED